MKPEHVEEMKARARNIRMTISYDGSAYHGFQRQRPPVTAVQNILEEKLETVFGENIEVAASGRTDAGVHACGQVVNFFTNCSIPTERIPMAMNSLLPEDIVVLEAQEADRDFSARHSAKSKIYIYKIFESPLPDPFKRLYSWHIKRSLDDEKIQEAMDMLLGVHDFSAFRATGGAPMSPVREMYEASCSRNGKMLELRFHANGFLYHMARNIVGTLANVGLGRITPKQFKEILESKDRGKASATAPARGLYLYKVFY